MCDNMVNVLDKMAKKSVCSGCGVCAVACPAQCLTVRDNGRGELRPVKTDGDCVNCGACLCVCPFPQGKTAQGEKEPSCYIGWAKEYRWCGSSGGVATWFLCQLLEERVVDAVVTVQPRSDPDELFAYTVCETREELLCAQGSAYYPVCLEEVLRSIEGQNRRVAVVAVPCFARAVQRLRAHSPRWREKIPLVIGLVCGHTPGKGMVDALAWSSGHSREQIRSCRFRIPSEDRPAWDYGMRLEFTDAGELTSFGSEDFGFLFWRRLFAQPCCDECDDVFAREADITFMDAWLPEYREERGGRSMILSRKKQCDAILSRLVEAGELVPVSPESARKAQEKLIQYKTGADRHDGEKRLRERVGRLMKTHWESQQIMDMIRRECYKQELREKNLFAWGLLELKDRITGI